MKRGEWIFMGKAGRSWVSLHSVSGSVGHTVWGITRVVTPTKVTTKHGSTEITIPRMGKTAIIIMQKRRDNQTTNLADADIWASDQLMKCQLHVCPSASVSAGVITYRISQSKSETRTQIRSVTPVRLFWPHLIRI